MTEPEPILEVRVIPPLLHLCRSCEKFCTAECCGMGAFDVSPTHIAEWLQGTSPQNIVTAHGQFEQVLNAVELHRGPVTFFEVNDDGLLDHWESWQTQRDCLAYFNAWRQAIAAAIRDTNTPLLFSPTWLTEPVVALRESIIAERAFDRLPILADALEEAGCDNHFVLDHLRANDDHAYMCWVLDLLSVGGGHPIREQ